MTKGLISFVPDVCHWYERLSLGWGVAVLLRGAKKKENDYSTLFTTNGSFIIYARGVSSLGLLSLGNN
jgi:hypothetical protein